MAQIKGSVRDLNRFWLQCQGIAKQSNSWLMATKLRTGNVERI